MLEKRTFTNKKSASVRLVIDTRPARSELLARTTCGLDTLNNICFPGNLRSLSCQRLSQVSAIGTDEIGAGVEAARFNQLSRQ